jgi:hypothetical protein
MGEGNTIRRMVMVQVLQRYKIIIFILSFLILAGAIWAMYTGHNAKKIPMRGVFVLEQVKIDRNISA